MYIFFSESKEGISCNVLHKTRKSLLQLIAWFDDVIHQDLDDTGESSLLVSLLLTVSRGVITSQVGLVSTNLLILQGGCEDSPANTNTQ